MSRLGELRMTTIAIILARAGSSGIPNKNLITGPLLCGKPLITYTVDAAVASCDCVLVSTNDGATLDYADAHPSGRVFGVRRPEHLCTATTASEPCVLHAIGSVDAKDDDAIVFLQLTSPLRTAAHITEALAAWRASGLPTCVSVEPGAGCLFAGEVVDGAYYADHDIVHNATRQSLSCWRRENGAIYIGTAGRWRETARRVSRPAAYYDMSARDSIDIDTPDDLAVAEVLMQRRGT